MCLKSLSYFSAPLKHFKSMCLYINSQYVNYKYVSSSYLSISLTSSPCELNNILLTLA